MHALVSAVCAVCVCVCVCVYASAGERALCFCVGGCGQVNEYQLFKAQWMYGCMIRVWSPKYGCGVVQVCAYP